MAVRNWTYQKKKKNLWVADVVSTSGWVGYWPTSGWHYSDVIVGAMASQITNLKIVYLTVYSGVDQIKHESSAQWPLCGEFTGERGIPRKNASNEENVSIWWRLHGGVLGVLAPGEANWCNKSLARVWISAWWNWPIRSSENDSTVFWPTGSLHTLGTDGHI